MRDGNRGLQVNVTTQYNKVTEGKSEAVVQEITSTFTGSSFDAFKMAFNDLEDIKPETFVLANMSESKTGKRTITLWVLKPPISVVQSDSVYSQEERFLGKCRDFSGIFSSLFNDSQVVISQIGNKKAFSIFRIEGT